MIVPWPVSSFLYFRMDSSRIPATSGPMDTQQLLDSLTAHIALYHHRSLSSSSSSSSSSDRNPNPRKSILRWFSAISIHQRQSYLTILDPDFVRVVTQMQSRLLTHGHGFFFLLPDLPSSSNPSLPTICFRRSHGLLSRHSSSNELVKSIFGAVRMFGSMEGSDRRQCAALDALTVSEDFVSDVSRFVETMDAVSDGGFLRGDVDRSGSSWHELSWLKEKGYYSLEAFVANKLECQLRMSWMNANPTKKQRAIKSKDKVGAADIAASAFWRRKGDTDWFLGLDSETRKKIYAAFLGKGAKYLVREVVKTLSNLKDGTLFLKADSVALPNVTPLMRQNHPCCWSDLEFSLYAMSSSFCRRKSMFSDCMIEFVVLQQLNAILVEFLNKEPDAESFFYSKLCSVQTTCDYVSRSLRGFIILVARDFVEFELMGYKTIGSMHHKNEKKVPVDSMRSKKKKGRSSKLNAMTQPKNNAFVLQSCREQSASCLKRNKNTATAKQRKTTVMGCALEQSLENNKCSSALNTEQITNLVDDKEAIPAERSGRKVTRSRGSNLNERTKPQTSEINSKENFLLNPSTENEEVKNNRIIHACSPSATDFSLQDKMQSPLVSLDYKHPAILSDTEVIKVIKDSNSFAYCQNRDQVKSGSGNHTAIGHFPASLAEDGRKVFSPTPIKGNSEKTNNCSFDSKTPNIPGGTASMFSRQVDSVGSCNEEHCSQDIDNNMSGSLGDRIQHPTSTENSFKKHVNINESSNERENKDSRPHNRTIYVERTSYEWPNLSPNHFSRYHSNQTPAATDRYHLDVAESWPNHFHQSFSPARQQQVRNASIESGCGRILPPNSPMSFDWPPMVRNCTRLSQSGTASYDSVYNSRLQSSFCTGISDPAMHYKSDSEWTYSGDYFDTRDFKNISDFGDDNDSHWLSEEESDLQAGNGRDYNKFFGGGVMYWNTTDHVGTSFSRAPSHSSEDSSWAWHEADLKRAIDDMVDLPGLPTYNTSGVASPPANVFCSPFDSLGHGQQSHTYVISSNDLNVKVLESPCPVTDVPDETIFGTKTASTGVIEAVKGEPVPYPILRPIIIPNLSRNGSRSEFKPSRDRASPCVSSTRRDPHRIKRPPSPVVLCVPRAPRVPPPPPVGESRKQRGFPIVRSGSSSPRHWGMRNWYLEENNTDSKHLAMDGPEVVWAAWGSKNLSGGSIMRPIPGSLLQDRLIALSQLSRDQEHPDVAFPLQPPDLVNSPSWRSSLCVMQSLLQEEINCFCQKVAAENQYRKPYINWAVKRVARSLQVLWPRSRTNVYGSNATGLALPASDVDLVICLPPVRNLEPIKEAGILEGRNGIKETCLQHAARYLANQDWVKSDSLKAIENTAIPLIMLVAEVPINIMSSSDLTTGEPEPVRNCADVISIRLDISFKSPSHTGLQTTELVRELTEQFPACVPLALVLKQFLADRSLDHSYSGGLSSYCLVLLITRFLQHEHHMGRPLNQNLGSLLLDFLYFFGNVFDPRQMRVSIQGSGLYLSRERGHSIDPIHIDDPLCPTNNVGRNCFRIHQCIKAFADAYSMLESELSSFSCNCDLSTYAKLLPKIIPSIDPEMQSPSQVTSQKA